VQRAGRFTRRSRMTAGVFPATRPQFLLSARSRAWGERGSRFLRALELLELPLQERSELLVLGTRKSGNRVQGFLFQLDGLGGLSRLKVRFGRRVENCGRAADRQGPQGQFKAAF